MNNYGYNFTHTPIDIAQYEMMNPNTKNTKQ